MQALTVAARWLHFAAVIVLFGELAFRAWVAAPAFAAAAALPAGERAAAELRTLAVAIWCVALAVVSGVVWLAAQAAAMSGAPLAQALDRATLETVLGATVFGRVWALRCALACMLGAALILGRRAIVRRGTPAWLGCALVAGVLLAALAWMGHGNAEQGRDHVVHLSADALHLLAAGAWLGALPALARWLARARPGAPLRASAGSVVRRFSMLGFASVGTLLATGTVNAWYTVGSIPGLAGTDYGRLLVAKLALFGAMLVLAAANRSRHAPRLSDASASGAAGAASRALRRNAIAEAALGLAIVGIAAALGISIPAVHVQIVWPLPFTVEWDAGVAVVPAYPTTYARSPARYDVASIAAGERLYAANCVACHGPYGRGDGPAAAGLADRPADLTEHLFHHREGDLFWWLQHGIAGTPMPGFGERIAARRLWDLVNFLHAQADAEAARTMNARVDPWRPVLAPEFSFQIGSRQQETLEQQRGRKAVLLVLYTLPGSAARLHAISAAEHSLEQAGVRVVAVPLRDAATLPQPPGVDATLLADPYPPLASAYALFRRSATGVPPVPDHMEFLIDRDGYLRARWIPGQAPGWDRMPELLRQAVILAREKPRPRAQSLHVH
jgi:putative copper resistance protein D